MNYLKQLISDGEAPSVMRVLALLIVIPVMIVWTALSIKKGEFIIPDMKIVSLVIAAISGKTVQSFAEALTPATSTKPTAVTDAPLQSRVNANPGSDPVVIPDDSPLLP